MNTVPPLQRRTMVAGALATLGLSALPVRAQAPTKIAFGFTAVSDFATLFVAKEEGLFARRQLDVEPRFIPLNPSIPPAIQSDSLQMGGPTPSVYLQGVEGGLDHVVVTGGGTTSKTLTGIGFVARTGSGIKGPQDCVGRKIGVPGLGAFLHVTFRGWLKAQGVDYNKVQFVEAAFPQHADLLKGGSIDGVVTGDPFMARIVQTGAGSVVSHYTQQLPEGMPTILYTARRDWAQKNAAAVRAFREAIAEAATIVNDPKQAAKVREHIGKYIKMPPEALAAMQVSPPLPVVQESHLTYWVDLMRDQAMLKAPVNVSQLIAR